MPLLGIREEIEPETGAYAPEPAANYVFESFDAPIELTDSTGTRRYDGHVSILYSPEFPRAFRPAERGNRTWFHVEGEGLEECLERYGIPRNQAIVGAFESLALIPFLEEVQRHNVQRKPYWEDAVTLLCRTFFRNLSRVVAQGADTEQTSLYQRETLATLRRLRAHVHANLDQRWTVDEMARRTHFSPSYFSKQFAHHFAASPIEDLINARVRNAKLLLKHSSLSIQNIAERCGFQGAFSFHRTFRQRTGLSPGEFMRRERIASGENRIPLEDLSLLYSEPVGYWNFDSEDGIDQDYHFRYDRMTLHHGATVEAEPNSQGALVVDGIRAHAEVTDPIVDTSQSFTVCAWTWSEEKPGSDWMTAVSVGNEDHGNFYLQYCIRDGCYMFTCTASGTDRTTSHVRGTLTPEPGKWIHLIGVHDRENHTISLWENGELGGSLPFDTPWQAPGPTRFGAAVFWGVLTDFWAGRIAEVAFYNRALSADEIQTIYRHGRER